MLLTTAFNMAAVRHLGFLKIRNFNDRWGCWGQCLIVYHRTKVCDNRSNCC